MVTKGHTIFIDDDDWKCLAKYALHKDTSSTKIIQKLIYDFLSDHKDEINNFIEQQKKVMSKRNLV